MKKYERSVKKRKAKNTKTKVIKVKKTQQKCKSKITK